MCGARLSVDAISGPHVRCVVLVAIKADREQRERKPRRVEDVHQPAVAMPPDEFLPEESDGHEDELQVEPVVPEPQEQVGAEDDRERPEPEDEAAAARPRQQHVERVGEDDLRHQQPGVVVNRLPVPPPVRVDRDVAHRLDVVLRARRRQDDRQISRSGPEQVQAACQTISAPTADQNERRTTVFAWTRGVREIRNSASVSAAGIHQTFPMGPPRRRRRISGRLAPGLGRPAAVLRRRHDG